MPSKPLQSIFTHLNGEHPNLFLPTLMQDGRCTWCNLFVELSGKVLDCPVYLVSGKDSGFDFALPGWDGTRYVTLTNEKTACARLQNGEAVVRIYTNNRAFPGLPNATRLFVGDYAASRQLADLTAYAKGITRLAVCRMDVDNLGHAFVAGYRKPGETDPKKRDEYLNISRTSAFSRQMSLFFKCYIFPTVSPQTAPPFAFVRLPLSSKVAGIRSSLRNG